MADNIDQVQQSPGQTNPTDINFIQKEEPIKSGCEAEQHHYNILNMMPNGEMTTLELECIYCKKKEIRNEMMNVNELIDPRFEKKIPVADFVKQEDVIPAKVESQVQPPPPVVVPEWAPVIADRYKTEKEMDNFWDSIKGKR